MLWRMLRLLTSCREKCIVVAFFHASPPSPKWGTGWGPKKVSNVPKVFLQHCVWGRGGGWRVKSWVQDLPKKLYQNFFHHQYSKKLSWTVKVVLHSHHYFTIIYNFSDTVLGDMWRQLLSSTIYTGLASPVQSQGESGGRRLKNKNSNREQSERQNWQHRKEHAISNLTTIHQHLRERRPLVRRPVPPNAGQIWQSSVDRGRSSQEACTSSRS